MISACYTKLRIRSGDTYQQYTKTNSALIGYELKNSLRNSKIARSSCNGTVTDSDYIIYISRYRNSNHAALGLIKI